MIQNYFEKEILTEEAIECLPDFSTLNHPTSSLMVKLDEIMIIQDCIEDEFYQPLIKGSDGILINSGLWTRSIYEPEGYTASPVNMSEMNFKEFQVRKRLMAICKKTGKPFWKSSLTGEKVFKKPKGA